MAQEELEKISVKSVDRKYLDVLMRQEDRNLDRLGISEKEKKNILRRQEKTFLNSCDTKKPTDYQGTYSYAIIKYYSESIVKLLKESKVDKASKIDLNEIIVGTLPTGEVNATCIKVPTGGYIVAVNQGLFSFVYALAKSVSRFCPFTVLENGMKGYSFEEEDISRSIALDENKEGHYTFVEVLFSYFASNASYIDLAPGVEGLHNYLAGFLTEFSEFFVIAHEYAHLVLLHTGARHYI